MKPKYGRIAIGLCLITAFAAEIHAQTAPSAPEAFEQGQFSLCHQIARRTGQDYWSARCAGEAGLRALPCGRHCKARGSQALARLRSQQSPRKTFHQWLAARTVQYGRKPDPRMGEFIHAVARAESNFNAKAVSHAGALGYMQVMPRTARGILPASWNRSRVRRCLLQQDCNTKVGTHYLRHLLDRTGSDVVATLYAYNAGPARARRWRTRTWTKDPVASIDQIPIRETRHYVQRVLANLWSDRAEAGLHPGQSLRDLQQERWPRVP